MNNRRDVLCIIGARKGSKRLPGKNKLEIGGVPLYLRALRAALDSGVADKVLFSSDDEEMLTGASRLDGVLTDRRPEHLAGSKPSMWDVVAEILSRREQEFTDIEHLMLLNPCHPFRTGNHATQAMSLYRDSDALALISVTPYSCSPELALTVEKGLIKRSWSGLVRSGEKETNYYPNGAITIIRRDVLDRYKTPFTENTLAFELAWPYCLDIDTQEEFDLAQKLSSGVAWS